MSLISKDESIKDSMVHVGYLTLKLLDNKGERVTLTELSAYLRKHKVTAYRPMMIGLVFLHSIGAIDFKAPYIYKL